MKKQIVFLLTLLAGIMLFTGCSSNNSAQQNNTAPIQTGKLSGVVKTGGSTSVEKVMNSLIYQFQSVNQGATINYEMNGSGDGIKNTLSGIYEIGHSSRELKTDSSEAGVKTIPYAIDGIAIIINKENNISNLTKEQLKGIYTGEINNWNELGGKDVPITVITREAGSGTRAAFAEIIGLEKKAVDGKLNPETMIINTATIADNTGAVQTAVFQNPNAIGYMSYSDVDMQKIKTAKYEGVDISVASLNDNSYKLKREFYLLTKKDVKISPTAQGFIDFVLSDEGQKIIANNKLLPTR